MSGRPSKMDILRQLEQTPASSVEASPKTWRGNKMDILNQLETDSVQGSPSGSSGGGSSSKERRSKMDMLNQMEQLHSSAASPHMSRWDYLTSLDTRTVPAAPNNNLAPANAGENFYDEMPYSAIHKRRSGRRCRQFCDCLQTILCNRKMACLLIAIIFMTAISGTLFGVASSRLKHHAYVRSTATVSPTSVLYMFNEDITLNVKASAPTSTTWVGLWQDGKQPRDNYYRVSDAKPAMWMEYCGSDDATDATTTTTTNTAAAVDPNKAPTSFEKKQIGECPSSKTITFSENTKWNSDYTLDWPLCNGKWVACVLDTKDASVLDCSHDFAVYGGTCEGVCKPAEGGLSYWRHEVPKPGAPVSKIAFGSCFEPDNQVDGSLWEHMRNEFAPDLWVWLGDNIYAEGESMERKRETYNAAKNDPQYLKHGPLAEPKIPVTGTWDDHDSGSDNSGAEYQCHKLSQDEFAYYFDLPETDPRHPKQGEKQQKGVYSSIMFSKPNPDNALRAGNSADTNTTTTAPTASNENGVHLILLDVRTFRSPTFEEKGYCQGSNSTMLGEEQWRWLDEQLHQPSAIKVIGTAMQVMQPTDQKFNDVNLYCANDGDGFFDAIKAIGEDERYLGTQFESWNQIPQEKARLMQMLQQSLHQEMAKRIVIISGDMHWGEMMAKKMPESDQFGDAQVLYEVTASGIDKNWPYPDPNSNRVRVRTADSKGDGLFIHECKFPFIYEGEEFTECTWINEKKPWCAISVDESNHYFHPNWGYCQDEAEALVPRANITFSKENSCDDNLHICRARANYGGIEIDWERNFMTLSVFTPHANDKVAAQMKIGL